VDELGAAMAFDRTLRVRGARLTRALPGGIVVLHDGLPSIHHLNAVMLDAPLPALVDAGAIARIADAWLGHLAHRYVVLDDGAAGGRIAPELRRAGWSVQRTVFMSLRREADRAARSVAREATADEIRAVELQMGREEWAFGDDSLPARLIAGMDALRAGTRSRCFIAGDDGEPSAACTLFLERERGGIAMLDNVGTVTANRRRGFGRAVVQAAIDAAGASGCSPILIAADADDWPRELYARLGFEALGMQVALTLPAAQSGQHAGSDYPAR
jgi:GNAT superfamily N-acetyltransferase